MALPRITFNGRNIDLPQVTRLQVSYVAERNVNPPPTGGRPEIRTVRTDTLVGASWKYLADAELRRKLDQWWGWAMQGKGWAFAWDSAKTVKTTLDQNADSADTSVRVDASGGIVAGDRYYIRNAAHAYSVGLCDSRAGRRVNLTEALDYDFAVGDIFRSELYWQAVISSADYPVVDLPYGGFYDFQLRLTEDLLA